MGAVEPLARMRANVLRSQCLLLHLAAAVLLLGCAGGEVDAGSASMTMSPTTATSMTPLPVAGGAGASAVSSPSNPVPAVQPTVPSGVPTPTGSEPAPAPIPSPAQSGVPMGGGPVGTPVDVAAMVDAGPPPGASDAGTVDVATGSVDHEAAPSAGCGAGSRPQGGEVRVSNDHIYTFPASYDGTTPFPAVFAFHAAGNPIDQLYNITRGSDLPDNYVMVFPKSVGNGWSLSTDGPRFEGWMAELTENYCVDENRLFATGHSSGAQFVVQLLCQGEGRFAAVAPVASSVYCPSWEPRAALVIHGSHDSERASTSQDADGRKDLGPYLTSNACQMTSSPHPVMGCTSGQASVNPGCVAFDGCAAPLVWCQHDDPSYANTNHGWPCFANQAMFDFFEGVPGLP